MIKKILKEDIITTTARGYNSEVFRTGKSVTFQFRRNTESSKGHGVDPKRFQQNIEPAGRYMNLLTVPKEDLPDNFESGKITFKNPLVVPFNVEKSGMYDDNSWKSLLHNHYGESGGELSKEISNDGYDGIITVREGRPLEIVDISMF